MMPETPSERPYAWKVYAAMCLVEWPGCRVVLRVGVVRLTLLLDILSLTWLCSLRYCLAEESHEFADARGR